MPSIARNEPERVDLFDEFFEKNHQPRVGQQNELVQFGRVLRAEYNLHANYQNERLVHKRRAYRGAVAHRKQHSHRQNRRQCGGHRFHVRSIGHAHVHVLLDDDELELYQQPVHDVQFELLLRGHQQHDKQHKQQQRQ